MEDALPARNRPTLLVTGIASMLGANLALHLSERLRVVGFCQDPSICTEGCETYPWEPANTTDIRRRIRQVSPQWIIHCGEISRGSWDLPDRSPDGPLEASTCLELSRIAADSGIRLTVISTDAVFAGPRMFHDEARAPSSSRALALAARQVEQALESTPALVVRTHAYGWSGAGSEPAFAQRVWQALSEGVPCRVDPNRHATPILASDLANLLWRAYQRGLQGLWHIAGAERTSAYRFACELASVFGLTHSPFSSDEAEIDVLPPQELYETSLRTARAGRELNRPMPLVAEGLERFAQQLRNGTRDRLRLWGRTRSHAA